MSDEQPQLRQAGGNGLNAAIPLPPSATIETSDEPPRTLWMGDLDPSFDEVTIQEIWQQLGRRVFVKLIRAKKNLLIPCSSTAATSSTNAEAPATGENVAREGSPTSNEGELPGGLENAQKININGVSFIDPATTPLHHAGYCFVEFESQQDAQFALSLNSTPLPNFLSKSTNLPTNPTGQRNFRLNWASGATLQSSIPSRPEFSLFVGDLSPTATEADLLSLFQQKFRSVKTVRVMTDPITGASRCFGFVRFGNEEERRRALVEMNGAWCQGRCLRVAYATPRNNMMWHVQAQQQQSSSLQQQQATPLLVKTANNMMTSNQGALGGASNLLSMPMSQKSSILPISSGAGLNVADFSSSQAYTTDPNNTTVFIGGLTPKINEAQLQALFSPFGSIVTVKIPQGKNCGFVKYENRIDAEAAIQGMQGFIVGGNPIRLSWGRSTVGSGPSGPANASNNGNHHNNRKNEKPTEFQQITGHQYINQQHYGNEYQYMPMRHTASELTKVAPGLDRNQNVSTPLMMPSQQLFTQVRQQMWNNDTQWNNVPVEVYSETPVPNQQNMNSMLPQQQQYQRLQQSQNPMMTVPNVGPGPVGGTFNMNIAPNAGGISLPNARGNSNDVPPIHPSVLR
ncbi:hypothetical protein HG536_0H03780 [Torulaspora globosa]|uniref:RRM domain-containing protein n=1 Tax=Torulaspora globosa TaxID=48254 RepID=A0A7G3ZNB6_9SACH|nr:uncharacterized protein HG536_0H03780 [Torulaspora globosa]QLL35002.1 hypothetical protein HG536_0H03780 [Torulaspora globosa]